MQIPPASRSDAARPPVASEPAPAGLGRSLARDRASVAVWILAVIASVAALYLARAFFVPLLIGILTSYALRPAVDGLATCRIPRVLGAALVVIALVGSAGAATFSLGDDAASIVEELPEAARRVRQHLSDGREGSATALESVQQAATELQGAATDATESARPARPRGRSAAPAEPAPAVWLRDYMLTQSALLFSVVAQAPIVLLLAYFLLASGAHFRRKLVQLVGPSAAHKRDAVAILQEIDVQVQRYLLVTVAANVLVAVCTWLAFEALGMKYALAWGVVAGVLHFIPYLGPLAFALASGLAGFLQFGNAPSALSVAGVSLAVAAVIGSVLVTWVQGRAARVNAAVLFIALLFFGWLWGIWGLLLGAPLIAIAKVICDRVAGLRPAGRLLGQ